MATKKLTPWFPASVRPARKGVYNVSCQETEQSGNWYSYWDGVRFYTYAGISFHGGDKEAMRAAAGYARRGDMTDDQPATWRGLASDPRSKA